MRTRWFPPSVGCVLALFVTGCPEILPGTEDSVVDESLRAVLDDAAVTPVTKPTVDAPKVKLGQMLMFDKILSGNRNISCATCHHPAVGTGDGLSLSKGQGGVGLAQSRSTPLGADGQPILIPRNAPDVFNRGDFDTMFWDGRVHRNDDGSFTTPAGEQLPPGLDSALAAQAMFPVTSREEMRGHVGENELADLPDDDLPGIWVGLMARLLAIEEYRDLFDAAYPGTVESVLTFAHAANAIAAFEVDHWTLDDSPFDHYLRGDDSAMSSSSKRGALLFYGEAGCATCHSGPLLTDQEFHAVSVPQLGPGKGHGDDGLSDFGREAVSGDASDRYKFRTPSLRNVAATGPWMHDGAFTDLEATVRHMLDPITAASAYDQTQLAPEFRALYHAEQTPAIVAAIDSDELSAVTLTDEEVADLMAFLHALTSPSAASLPMVDIPDRVPSGLPLAD